MASTENTTFISGTHYYTQKSVFYLNVPKFWLISSRIRENSVFDDDDNIIGSDLKDGKFYVGDGMSFPLIHPGST
jgi:hypothetical protein